jgi:hypothetical protein
MAASIDQLTPSTWFYDQSSGLLFLQVEQDQYNGDASVANIGGGPSPLGSCTASSGDPCPDTSQGEGFYSCPSDGCELYMVQASSSAYPYDPTKTGLSQCTAYPTYAQPYPTNLNYLMNVSTKAILNSKNLQWPSDAKSRGGFPHLVDTSGAPCS